MEAYIILYVPNIAFYASQFIYVHSALRRRRRRWGGNGHPRLPHHDIFKLYIFIHSFQNDFPITIVQQVSISVFLFLNLTHRAARRV